MAQSRHERRDSRRAPAQQGMSTARALGLAGALIVSLTGATTGVLAATGMLDPTGGRAVPATARTGPPAAVAKPAAGAGEPAPGTTPTGPIRTTPIPTRAAPAPAPPQPPQPGVFRLIAFGATVADWAANHKVDRAVADGSAFNPDPTVRGDGRLADRYVKVLPLSGRILQYTVQLPRGTTAATAGSRALAELPPDLHLLWQQQRAVCVQASYTSATLAAVLSDLGDPTGAVLVEYRSAVTPGSDWNDHDVASATLSALDAPRAADAPLC
jgi:hypothetical protein